MDVLLRNLEFVMRIYENIKKSLRIAENFLVDYELIIIFVLCDPFWLYSDLNI